MKHLLPYGLRNGELVSISEVEKGLACDCICPACRHPLVARKGEKTVHHFAHHKGKECASGLETSLHLKAKEILANYEYIRLPATILPFGLYTTDWTWSEERDIYFDEVKLEVYDAGVKPDITGIIKGKPLLIEVTVTHKTTPEKIAKIEAQGLSLLEIDLSKFTRNFEEKELVEAVLLDTSNKKWLVNQLELSLKQQLEKIVVKKRIKGMSVFCSWWNKGVRVPFNCVHCGYYRGSTHDTVDCSYHLKIKSLKDMLIYLQQQNK